MTDSYQVSEMFLRALGAPTTEGMKRAVSIWLKFESGGRVIGNNPWNLHSGTPCTADKGFCPGQGNLPGQIGNRYAGPGDRNVAVFDTLEHGTQASANNLTRLAPSYGYGKVITEARKGNPLGFLTALQSSQWSAGHYSYSKLVTAFTSGTGYKYPLTLVSAGGSKPGNMVPPDAKDSTPSGGVYADKFTTLLKNLGISTDPAHQITPAEALKIVQSFGTVFGAGGHPTVSQFSGRTVGDVSGNLQSSGEAVANAPGSLLDVAGQITGVATKLVSYILAVVLIIVGLWLYKGAPGATAVVSEVSPVG